jgi:hypothetical protein
MFAMDHRVGAVSRLGDGDGDGAVGHVLRDGEEALGGQSCGLTLRDDGLTEAVVERRCRDTLRLARRRKVGELELVRARLDHGLVRVAVISGVYDELT